MKGGEREWTGKYGRSGRKRGLCRGENGVQDGNLAV